MIDARIASTISAIARFTLHEHASSQATRQPLYVGRLNRLFTIPDGLVLKLFLADAAGERCDRENRGLRTAHAGGVAVPEVVATGVTEGVPWIVTRRVPGVDARTSAAFEHPQATRIAHEVGRQLRRIHTLWDTSSKEPPHYGRGNVDELLSIGSDALTKVPPHSPLARAVSAAVAMVAKTPTANLPFGWIHGDFQDKNIVALDNEITAIVDFEHTRRSWRHAELVLENICCYATFSRERAAALQQALFDGYGLEAAECQAIDDRRMFYRAVALLEALLPHSNSLGALAAARDPVNAALERLAADLD